MMNKDNLWLQRDGSFGYHLLNFWSQKDGSSATKNPPPHRQA